MNGQIGKTVTKLIIKNKTARKESKSAKSVRKVAFFYKKPRTDRSKETIAEKFFIKNQCFAKIFLTYPLTSYGAKNYKN